MSSKGLTVIENRARTARRQIISAKDIPTLWRMSVHAEYMRQAAKKLGMHLHGVNALTRLKIDIEREADRRIKAMRATGELAEQGGDKKSKSTNRTLILPDLLGKRAKQRAYEWHRHSQLTEGELDIAFAAANTKLKLVPYNLLVKLGSAKLAGIRRENSRTAEPLPDGMDFRLGDCRSVLADVPDNSVALVLTDPPYAAESEPLYHWLAEWAARVLIPGGSLICYTGHWSINRDTAIFDKHLRFWWLLAMLHNESRRLPGKFIIANFKPVLWYVKGTRRGKSLVPDVLRPPQREKDDHAWGQGEGGVTDLIHHLTEPGETIVDPFAGTGQWGEIAARFGRKWIGADIVRGGSIEVAA